MNGFLNADAQREVEWRRPTHLLSAEDKAAAVLFKRRLVDGVLVIDVLQRRLEGQDAFDESSHVLRDAVVAGAQLWLDVTQGTVRHKVLVIASRASRRQRPTSRLGVGEAVVRLGDVVESLYRCLQFA